MLKEDRSAIGDNDSLYIVRDLGDMPGEALISEKALGDMFSRCPTSIKRAVERGELPPPTRLFGKAFWTAGAIVAHFESRLKDAKRKAEEESKRMEDLLP